jgi:hypothetical protein
MPVFISSGMSVYEVTLDLAGRKKNLGIVPRAAAEPTDAPVAAGAAGATWNVSPPGVDSGTNCSTQSHTVGYNYPKRPDSPWGRQCSQAYRRESQSRPCLVTQTGNPSSSTGSELSGE